MAVVKPGCEAIGANQADKVDPHGQHFDRERIEAFLKLLPPDTKTAAQCGRRHDDRLKARAWLKVDAERPIRHAFEIRHDSFRTPEFVDLLRCYNVALVCADTVEWPRLKDLTSDFVYCRLHGSEVLYASGYDDGSLNEWAERVAAWATGHEPSDAERINGKDRKRRRDVFVYFDNDMKVRAPFDAHALADRVSRRLNRPDKPLSRGAGEVREGDAQNHHGP